MTPERMKELEALDRELLRRDGARPALADALQDLRAAVDRFADQEYTLAARRRTRTVRLRWASGFGAVAATAAAVVVMLVPAHRPVPATPDQSTGRTTLSDDSLLTAVQSDLSSSVPLPMEALTPTATTSSSNSSTQSPDSTRF